jgi:hypothetical protein
MENNFIFIAQTGIPQSFTQLFWLSIRKSTQRAIEQEICPKATETTA